MVIHQINQRVSWRRIKGTFGSEYFGYRMVNYPQQVLHYRVSKGLIKELVFLTKGCDEDIIPDGGSSQVCCNERFNEIQNPLNRWLPH